MAHAILILEYLLIKKRYNYCYTKSREHYLEVTEIKYHVVSRVRHH